MVAHIDLTNYPLDYLTQDRGRIVFSLIYLLASCTKFEFECYIKMRTGESDVNNSETLVQFEFEF